MDRLPIVYVRGYAGPTAGIDAQVDDPFYGFNHGATHVRVGGDGDPAFYQFEGPLLRLMTDEDYRLLVQGDQHRYLREAADASVPPASLWVYRFYDQAATTFAAPPHESLPERLLGRLHRRVSADGFDIETAAAGLYDLIGLIRRKTGAPKVYLVAHSMGGLVARCMMQKTCRQPDADGRDRRPARELVARFFTYGTPHGGIAFRLGVLNWAEQAFGPAGSDIFAPEKMYGYLDPGARFGDLPPRSADFDPQRLPEEVFDTDDVFCLVGTDPRDYGLSRVPVGPKSDGLVRIEHAYVRGAHRAYVYRSHSGTYGEVNSEEGYQNLRRFLFGRWQVRLDLVGLPGTVPDTPVWQADTRLTIRGLPIVMTEQSAAHWCPVQLGDEIRRRGGKGDGDVAVPVAGTFLLDRDRLRYALGLRVFTLDEDDGRLRLTDHLEQVPAWADTLVVDVRPGAEEGGIAAWAAWNSMVEGPPERFDPITDGLPGQDAGSAMTWERTAGAAAARVAHIPLPAAARALSVLGPNAALRIEARDRLAAT
ncbi:esterase/lipase family protein [Streptomyces hainanensis]|uniref:Alpha/beta hydrolase n=1 Tax=Streptomyces hainanensis TaxID=402648 RepID=A0A4R4SG25_9ACTN|nr:alpha/beta hydrolase [Streptomyces hainanensis]TDC62377.1 alpha/beta hydrolase [Streptomyces hainanensis]